MWTNDAGIELSRASLRVSSTCNCLDLVPKHGVDYHRALGLLRGQQNMSFSWAYGKIDREELQKVGCSND